MPTGHPANGYAAPRTRPRPVANRRLEPPRGTPWEAQQHPTVRPVYDLLPTTSRLRQKRRAQVQAKGDE